ncbi:MAG: Rpn family recombination-promoting nuclease/putative transposase [Gemmatimonadota bacterium]|nr:Rpn family recombination-promoting nuclease/putative transposase [Gemmatimonadota bacterium]MDE2984760.1 Rpn family recombination-promoting nuclease/putative transposase [Gemmatimonadota bacterium]
MARKHDETYKLIFSQRGAVEDLLRSFVGGDLAEELDFGTLEALPTDRISDDLVRRQVDILWKIRFRGNWLYLLILLEFQSEVDHFMALRILTYTCLTYEELVRRNELGADGKLPPLLPITVYNGPARWRAATDISQLIAPVPPPLRRHLPRAEHILLDLQRIGERDPSSTDLVTSLGRAEREPSAENLRRLMRDMAGRFPAPVFAELRKALLTWVAGAAETWQISRDALARIRTLTEDETMYERVREMREQVHRDGVRKGLEQGLERGLERGRAEGRRALVGRLATRKFGARTAKQLSRVLEDIADPERLAEVFDAVIDCDSDAELFARVGM